MFTLPPFEITSSEESVTRPLSPTEIRLNEEAAITAPRVSLVTIAGAKEHVQVEDHDDDPYLAELLASACTETQIRTGIPMRFGTQSMEARWRDVRPNDRLAVPGPAALPATPQMVAALDDGTREVELHDLEAVASDASSSEVAPAMVVRVPASFPAGPDDLDYWAMTYARGWPIPTETLPVGLDDDWPDSPDRSNSVTVQQHPKVAKLVQIAYRITAIAYAYRCGASQAIESDGGAALEQIGGGMVDRLLAS